MYLLNSFCDIEYHLVGALPGERSAFASLTMRDSLSLAIFTTQIYHFSSFPLKLLYYFFYSFLGFCQLSFFKLLNLTRRSMLLVFLVSSCAFIAYVLTSLKHALYLLIFLSIRIYWLTR